MKPLYSTVLLTAFSVFSIHISAQAPIGMATPSAQTVCTSEAITSIVLSTSNGMDLGTTYAWTRNNTSSVIGLSNSGTGNISGVPLNVTTSPKTVTYTIIPTNGGTDGDPFYATVTVNPVAQVNDPSDQVVCNLEITDGIFFSTYNTGGTTSYTWIIGPPVNSSGSGNITPFIADNEGSSPSVYNFTVTPHFTNGGVTCDGPTEEFTITMNPTAQVDDPADQVLCNTENTSAVHFTTDRTGGTTIYTWTNDTPSIGLAASGTGDIATFAAVNVGTDPVVATITVTPHFTNGGVTCDGPTEEFTITVNPTAQVNDPGDQVVCNSENTAAVNFTTDRTGGTTIFSWTNNTPSIGLAASGIGNIASFAAVNAGTSPVVATITVTPHFTNGGVTCAGSPVQLTITVNPTAQVDVPADQVVCNTDNTAAITFTTDRTGGTTTYTWTNDTPGIGLAASGSGNIPSFAAVNVGTSPVVATITVTPHFTNGSVTCDGPSEDFTITVNPTAQVDVPLDQVVCNSGNTAAVNFTTDRTGGTTIFSWTNNTPSIGLAASGIGNIASFAAVNPGNLPVIATIAVTPHYTSGSVTCDGPSEEFTISVNPTAQVDDPADQVVCNTDNTAATTFTTDRTGGTTTYTWTNNTPGIGLAASGSGNIASFTAVNAGTSPVVAAITVTPHFTNGSVTCDGPTQQFTIAVNPTAQVYDPADQIVQHGENTAAVSFATNRTGGTTSYSWTNDTPSIGLAASGTGNIASFAAINEGTTPVLATITVTPHFTSGGVTCEGPPVVFTFTVNPSTPTAYAGVDQEICGSLNAVLEGNDPTIGDGEWTQVSGPGTITFGNANVYNTSASASEYGTYVLQWAITYDGVTTSDVVDIILNEDPVLASAGTDQALCGLLTTDLEGTSHTYQSGNTPTSSTRQWSYVSGPDSSPVFSEENNPASSVTVSSYGSYVFRWTETNGNCIRTDDVAIVFSDNPDVDGGPDQEVCFGESVTLTGTGDGAISWDQGVINGTSFIPTETREYHISVLNGYGCSNSDAVLVVVNPLPDANAGPDQEVCSGESVTLTATGGTLYTWDHGVSNGIPFTPTTNAEYTVIVTDDNGCTDQDQVLVNVKPVPQTPTIAFDSDTLFSDSDLGNQWYMDESLIVDAVDTFYVPNHTGTYYTIVTADGCASDASNNIFVQITGIIQNDLGDLKIYPNPTDDFITIEAGDLGGYSLRITASNGQIMLQEVVNDPLYTIDLSGISKGVYFITIRSKDAFITRKIVKL